MSGEKKVQQNKEQKIATRYDLKMQRRKEEKARQEKLDRIGKMAGAAFAVALACLIASFPIRAYLAVHETYVRIDGEDVAKIEFDYHYNLAKSNYISQYGYYLSYMGFDPAADPALQAYSEKLTWKDYFEQMAVDSMKQNKALQAQAKAEGFSYDTSEEYDTFVTMLKEQADANKVSVKEYVKNQYGVFATLAKVKPFIEEGIFLNAYYNHVRDGKAPAEEAILERYQSDANSYDSVDYRLSVINAELPTEPTELADASANAAPDVSGDDQAAYEPSQAEIDKAMADAKAKAEEAEKTIARTGEAVKGGRWIDVEYDIREWLFDSARKAGDATVVENASNHCYYVAAFEKRYRDETPSADVRALVTKSMSGQDVLDEWKGGEATEESFAQLCRKYSEDSAAASGGLYQGLIGKDMDESIAGWIFDAARQKGDTTSVTDESGDTYVVYYIGKGEPAWKLEIKNEIQTEAMNQYLAEITDKVTVEDPKGKLNYLKVEAEADVSGNDGADADIAPAESDSAPAESTAVSESTGSGS